MKTIIIILFVYVQAFSWGTVDHKTVMLIAEKYMTYGTLEKIDSLLFGESRTDAAIWADTYKQNHPYTSPWHYINLPIFQDVTAATIPRFYGKRPGSNLIMQLQKNIDMLASINDRGMALKYVIHFMGDIHMPLHVGDNNDQGGNDVHVRFFPPNSLTHRGHVTNLHSLWDNLIEIKAMESPEILAGDIDQGYTDVQRQSWRSGIPSDWAFESYKLSKDVVYHSFKQDTGIISLDDNYYSRMRPYVFEQIEKAGIRLAWLLEGLLK